MDANTSLSALQLQSDMAGDLSARDCVALNLDCGHHSRLTETRTLALRSDTNIGHQRHSSL